MEALHIITPVKDSIELTLQTIEAVMNSTVSVPFEYTIYNDFSTPENTTILKDAAAKYGFTLVNLEDITTNPSPNYLLVLRTAQKKAISAGAGLLIIESDVVVKSDTVQRLFEEAKNRPDCGIAASATVDETGAINYPYLFAKGKENSAYPTRKHLSFCCSLLTLNYLRKFDFATLNPEKNWHDVTISRQSLKEGFTNYLFTNLPVWHRPHSSRPWKLLKYTNPVKYYWLKITKRRDKI
ncbi:MAG: glycosyltransferase family A protein [Bacteroidales bacterium]